jgi:hypothetical protein
MLIRDASFVVLDIETTGLSAMNNRITEIALLRVESGQIVDRHEMLINPEQYISPFIAEYTKITNAMVFGKPLQIVRLNSRNGSAHRDFRSSSDTTFNSIRASSSSRFFGQTIPTLLRQVFPSCRRSVPVGLQSG